MVFNNLSSALYNLLQLNYNKDAEKLIVDTYKNLISNYIL